MLLSGRKCWVALARCDGALSCILA